jgi:ABC-type glutathione transport system ATPase component
MTTGGLLDTRLASNGVNRPVLEVHRVTKIYPSEPPVTALRDVSFTVGRGELVRIAGPSGSGKTTLLDLMGQLVLGRFACSRSRALAARTSGRAKTGSMASGVLNPSAGTTTQSAGAPAVRMVSGTDRPWAVRTGFPRIAWRESYQSCQYCQ